MENVKEILARNIRLERARQNISQEDLADLADIDRTYVSGIERGVRNPTIVIVAKCAKALGVTTSTLLNADFQKPKQQCSISKK